uniref:Uncharacterized protein n=1 Tax=Rhizophagus irregularis (strain DAOM 181602 / DAOM 197198 / MUCL 43194) TaxID=747089 RepID=U9T999_RHIID
MKTHYPVIISLVSPGILVERLHYGPYSHYWWQLSPLLPAESKKDKKNTYFPIRVNQKTKATLNNHEFTTTIVVGNKDNNNFLPGYVCQCEAIVEIANDPTTAISEVYSKVFATETRYSGLLIMGWNNENIIKELCDDVSFISQSFLLDKIKIFVYGTGYSSHTDWFHAGPGYKSSLLYKFNENKQALFVSKIEEDFSCILKIYQDQILKSTIKGKNPIDVWKTLGLIKKFNGNQLFGVENYVIQSLNKKQKVLTCSPQEWKNPSIMESLFDFHLKRRTTIMYTENYKFNIRELRAWNAFLHAVGAHNVTPWSNDDECQMGFLVKDISMPLKNSTQTFWRCFNLALENNKKNYDGKRRVLSIIAEDFTYEELQKNLGVSIQHKF